MAREDDSSLSFTWITPTFAEVSPISACSPKAVVRWMGREVRGWWSASPLVVVFTDMINRGADLELAEYINSRRLGRVRGGAVRINPNTNNRIRAWLWEIDYHALRVAARYLRPLPEEKLWAPDSLERYRTLYQACCGMVGWRPREISPKSNLADFIHEIRGRVGKRRYYPFVCFEGHDEVVEYIQIHRLGRMVQLGQARLWMPVRRGLW